MQHLHLSPISVLQSLHFANKISALSPAISPLQNESSSISNTHQTFGCILVGAAALTAMINSLAPQKSD